MHSSSCELPEQERAELRRSLANPHVESSQLAGKELGDWVRRLPADKDLLDESAGTPVRWILGQGWVEAPE